MGTYDHGLSLTRKGPGADANGLTGLKKVLASLSLILVVAEYARVF